MKGVIVDIITNIQKEIDTERNIQEKIKMGSEWFNISEVRQIAFKDCLGIISDVIDDRIEEPEINVNVEGE